ncbi:permease for cytosine/purines, uracil, thiamine, allantoin-domain-containing protein [Aspergillus undulatus]|uniref:permease for cytosine/purines, uracil, thiamine, allantoin-domain-containing protein n=1 Tax=Aspergillus undulatus TaxID=1810928 RepID=UPI003CCD3006
MAREVAFFSLVCPQVVDTQPRMMLFTPSTPVANVHIAKYRAPTFIVEQATTNPTTATTLEIVMCQTLSLKYPIDKGYWTVSGSCVSAWSTGSTLLSFGLSPQQAIGVVILGGFLSGLLAVFCGWMGEVHHIGFTVSSRFSCGMRRSYFPVILRTFVSCMWFGMQAFWGGQATRVMIGAIIPGTTYLSYIYCGMDLAGLWPKYLNIRRGGYVMAVIGIATRPWQLISTADKFLSVLSGFGVFMAPATGLMLADYHLIRCHRLKLSDLYRGDSKSIYWFRHGVNWPAFAAFAAGMWPLLRALPWLISSNLHLD